VFNGADFIVADASPRILWSQFYDDHDELIEFYHLNSWNTLRQEPRIARVNCRPVSYALEDIMDPDGWTITVSTEPEWFEREKYEAALRSALRDWHAAKIIGSGQHTVSVGEKYVFGTAKVVAQADARVWAFHHAQVTGNTCDRLYGYDSATITTIGCNHLFLGGNAHANVTNTVAVTMKSNATCCARRASTVRHEGRGLLELRHYSVGYLESGIVDAQHSVVILRSEAVTIKNVDSASVVINAF